MENAYNNLVNNLINLNLSSICTQETVSHSNTLLTDANQELSHKWTSCDESNPSDNGYGAYYWLMKASGGTAPTTLPTASQLPPGVTATTGPTNMADWVTDFLGNTNYPVSNLSSTFMTSVYSAFETYASALPPKSKRATNASGLLGLISQMTSLVQARSQADLQTGQNGITLLNNMAQHFESDLGPLSSATTTIVDGLNNYSSAMSQISA